jgi:hypothetical protein
MDVLQDGTGIETAGWFRSSRNSTERNDETMVKSRMCALHWVIVLYESVVPDPLKADVRVVVSPIFSFIFAQNAHFFWCFTYFYSMLANS